MNFNFKALEKKWQKKWQDTELYKTKYIKNKEKYYCLDMFPYPSGAGLHVGHPRGYIASDIISRLKRMQGYNVLHPMGYDAFGLPAEQYAVETGQHPAVTTQENIIRFRAQLKKIGFSFDPTTELQTCDPKYYHWTQWIFTQLFNSWYDPCIKKASDIKKLISIFERDGNKNLPIIDSTGCFIFSANDWKLFSDVKKSNILMNYRLAYRTESEVNWCPELGTVLANDEIKDGLSERGGHPVTKKTMKQWMLRITTYADRLLENLEDLDWPDSLKEIQKNWIGKSLGYKINFSCKKKGESICIPIFTTKPETIYGCTAIVLAPEHPLVEKITTSAQKKLINEYIILAQSRSKIDRQGSNRKSTGCFTGEYVKHPITGKDLPILIGDYVLNEYGTGAVMVVPAADERDFHLAKNCNLEIITIFKEALDKKEPYEILSGTLINSDILNELHTVTNKKKISEILANLNLGEIITNYKMRDAVFGRQRYWGEPIPIYYDDDNIPHSVNSNDLPLVLPQIDEYSPNKDGQPLLAKAKNWKYKGYNLETTTMPGWAGSSWYFLRYMDTSNTKELVSLEKSNYWNHVDCYMGGAEHATGHLLYSRFWNMFLYDIGKINFQEPFKKIVCQGMILGTSALIYKDKNSNRIISSDILKDLDVQPLHINIDFVKENNVDIEKLKQWRKFYKDYDFVLNDEGKLHCTFLNEKMSKSKYNVVVPDKIIDQYGADCFRLHEMFLGPIDQSVPWSIDSIEGSAKFIKRFLNLFFDEEGKLKVSNSELKNKDALRITHQTIKKVKNMTENMAFNTAIANLMSCVNFYTKYQIYNRDALTILLKLLHPYAPYITEELWEVLGNKSSIIDSCYPIINENYLIEDGYSYPISINGKVRDKLTISHSLAEDLIQQIVLEKEELKKWLEGKKVEKFIFVRNKIINIVVK